MPSQLLTGVPQERPWGGTDEVELEVATVESCQMWGQTGEATQLLPRIAACTETETLAGSPSIGRRISHRSPAWASD